MYMCACMWMKLEASKGKAYIDVDKYSLFSRPWMFMVMWIELEVLMFAGFWEGLIPETAFNPSKLEGLLDAGALGLKARTLNLSDKLFHLLNFSF